MVKKLSPVQAIKSFCLECSGGSAKMARECVVFNCSLYPFRLGKNPNRARVGEVANLIKNV